MVLLELQINSKTISARIKTKYNTVTNCLPVTFSFTLAGGGDECINWVLTRVRGVFLSILAHINVCMYGNHCYNSSLSKKTRKLSDL